MYMQVFGENLHRSFGSRRILQLESQTRRIFDRKQSTTTNKLRGSLRKRGPLDFATKNTIPLFFVAEEALVGIY